MNITFKKKIFLKKFLIDFFGHFSYQDLKRLPYPINEPALNKLLNHSLEKNKILKDEFTYYKFLSYLKNKGFRIVLGK